MSTDPGRERTDAHEPSEPVIDWSFFSMAKYVLTARTDDPRVMTGEEWDGFLIHLGEAAELVRGAIPATAADRAAAFRGLLQLLQFGLERLLGAADPLRPVFSRPWPVHLYDYGAGNPDAVYHTVTLRDDVTYRVSGTLGNAPFTSFEFFDGVRQAGSLLVDDLRPGADGRFEVLFGPVERPGHWLRVLDGTSYLLTREFFADWATATPARLQIECLDAPEASWPIMTADRVAKEIEALGQWLVATVGMFTRAHADGMAKYPNGFEPQASRANSDLPAIYHGFWDLSPDECLLIETPEPRGAYWGFQLSNGLWNTLDHANRQTSLNPAQTHVDADGMIRIVLAHSDPGVRNWLDTLGHRQGAIHVRLSPPPRAQARPARRHRSLAETRDDWMRKWAASLEETPAAQVHPSPVARVVKLADIHAELPPGTAHADRAERCRTLDDRLRQITRLQRS